MRVSVAVFLAVTSSKSLVRGIEIVGRITGAFAPRRTLVLALRVMKSDDVGVCSAHLKQLDSLLNLGFSSSGEQCQNINEVHDARSTQTHSAVFAQVAALTPEQHPE
jgi:hypothetical protein